MSANYEKNRLIQKIPCLSTEKCRNSLREYGEVAGALFFYVVLKQAIKKTLEYGFKYNTVRHSATRPKVDLIEDKVSLIIL